MPCEIVTWSLPSGNGRRHQIGRVLAWLAAVIRMRRLVAGLAPDLVIAYRTTSYGFLGAVSGFHPLVVAAQGESDAWPLDSPLVGFKRWMARVCLRNADLIHAWGAHIAQEQLSLGAAPHKILVRPRGVDLSKFYPSPSGPPIDALRLVSTRSLFPEYRHEIILEAVAAVARHGIPIFLDIAGDGVLSERLRSQALRLGISEHVRFHGQIFHDRLPELLRQCNVYVAMPITEGVSASLLEAMASGCYPVVTDLVANRHWITPPTNGDLVRVDDVEDARARVGQSLGAERCLCTGRCGESSPRSGKRIIERQHRVFRSRVSATGCECLCLATRLAFFASPAKNTTIRPSCWKETACLAEYRRRAREIDGRLYAPWQPAEALMRTRNRTVAAQLLHKAGVFPAAGTPCLEVGFGSLGWLADLISWGVREVDLHGVELDRQRAVLAQAKLPNADLRVGDATQLPWEAETFHLVIASTVFTSILDGDIRRKVAGEIQRVLVPGGALLWYDFIRNNPANPHVRKVSRRDVRELFPELSGEMRSITLAPPIARVDRASELDPGDCVGRDTVLSNPHARRVGESREPSDMSRSGRHISERLQASAFLGSSRSWASRWRCFSRGDRETGRSSTTR